MIKILQLHTTSVKNWDKWHIKMFHGDCLAMVLVIKYFDKCAVMDEYAPLKSSVRSYSTFLYMGLLHNMHCLPMSQRAC